MDKISAPFAKSCIIIEVFCNMKECLLSFPFMGKVITVRST